MWPLVARIWQFKEAKKRIWGAARFSPFCLRRFVPPNRFIRGSCFQRQCPPYNKSSMKSGAQLRLRLCRKLNAVTHLKYLKYGCNCALSTPETCIKLLSIECVSNAVFHRVDTGTCSTKEKTNLERPLFHCFTNKRSQSILVLAAWKPQPSAGDWQANLV